MPREGDGTIMEAFWERGADEGDLCKANAVRVHLRAFWVSDICDAAGTGIHPVVAQHRRAPRIQEDLVWPAAVPPSRQAWAAWDNMVRTLLVDDRPGMILRKPLGKWKHLRKFRVVQDEDGSVWWRCSGSPLQRVQTLEFRCRRVGGRAGMDVDEYRGLATVVSMGAEVAQRRPHSLYEHIAQLGGLAAAMLKQVRIHGSARAIADSIVRGTCVACCDASAKDQRGSAAAVIQDRLVEPTAGILIQSEVPEGSRVMDSNRAETAGVLLTMQFLKAFAQWAQVQGSATIACDSMQAIRASTRAQLLQADDNDYDLRSEIQHVLRTSAVCCEVQHVKGHADSQLGHQISAWEVLNVVADHEAGQQWQATDAAGAWGTVQGNPKSTGWAVRAGGDWLSEASYHAVSDATMTAKLRLKWRQRWGSLDRYSVDWAPLQKVMSTWRGGKQRTILKLASGNAATGRNMCRRQQSDRTACPCCGCVETNQHVMQCKSTASQELWDACIQRVRHIIQPPRVKRDAAQLLVKALRVLRQGGAPPQGIRRSTTLAIEVAQHGVGWDGLLWGAWSVEWIRHSPNPQPSSNRRRQVFWQAEVTHELWHMALQQWASRNHALHDAGERSMMSQRMHSYCRALLELPSASVPRHLRQLAQHLPDAEPRKAEWLLSMLHGMPHVQATVPPEQMAWLRRRAASHDEPTTQPAAPTFPPRRPSNQQVRLASLA